MHSSKDIIQSRSFRWEFMHTLLSYVLKLFFATLFLLLSERWNFQNACYDEKNEAIKNFDAAVLLNNFYF